MRLLGIGLLAVLTTAAPAWAFGRGGVARGGAVAGPRGAAVGGSRAGVATGPYGGVHAGASRSGTYVGPGGTTVQAGRVGGVSSGPLGGTRAGGASAAKVTTPSGQTYTKAQRGGVAVGPAGGVRAGGAAGAAASGPYGSAAIGHRGGVAVGPGGAVRAGGASGAAAVGPYGAGAVGRAGGVAVGPYGGVRAGGVAVAHSTRYVSPTSFHTYAAGVRGVAGYRYFTPTWYAAHPVAWAPARWAVPNYWAAPAWAGVSTFVGVAAPPVTYDYGSTVVIQDNTVSVEGQPAGSAADYAAQAVAVADAGRAAQPAPADEWQPLGVFGLMQGEEQVAQRIFQLAVNKAGVVRGNYYDAVADSTLPVFGSVDPKSQRVAWSIGEKKDIVFEAGLKNLTQDQTTVLVHYGKDNTQQMALVRLPEPQPDPKQ